MVWAEALPAGTSAQWAELIALTKALCLGKDKKINIYTDSRYAFATLHIHGAIYMERGLLTAEGKTIKNKQEILKLLQALWLPKKLAVMHCPGHQKGTDVVSKGNNLADQKAREIATLKSPVALPVLTDPGPRSLPLLPKYDSDKEAWASQLEGAYKKDGWWQLPSGKVLLPRLLGEHVLIRIHQTSHLGTRKLRELISGFPLKIRQASHLIDKIVMECKACQLVNVQKAKGEKGTRMRGTRPGTYWEIDFTEIKPGKYGYKYLLVLVDTFQGGLKPTPTKHETAHVVAKKILEEILPRLGFPHMIGSDNGPAFISQVSQGIATALGAKWKLHCAYRPQSSGQVERMNWTLKETLTKLALETGGDWVTLLPFALFRVRNSPYQLGMTPFKIMYGLPPPLVPSFQTELILPPEEVDLLESLKTLT